MAIDGYIHSLETFGTVDGPGTRLVVFLQGCNMKCKYCHNPDSWQMNIGKTKSTDEVLKIYNEYKPFLKDGGITVSGGEPLLQIDFVTELFEKARSKGIHTCLDTSGSVYNENNSNIIEKLDKLLKVTNLVMLDIKHIDNIEHKNLTGMENTNILKFAKYLESRNVKVRIRHVVVPTITLNNLYLYQLGYFLGSLNNIEQLEVLPYHLLGKSKWEALGKKYPLEGINSATKKEAEKARLVILKGMQDFKNS